MNQTMNHREALSAIQRELSGVEWTTDTLEAIAEVMRQAGYSIEEPDTEVCFTLPGRYRMRDGNEAVVTGTSLRPDWPLQGYEVGDEDTPMDWKTNGQFSALECVIRGWDLVEYLGQGAQPGSVISGTLRRQDIIPEFAEWVRILNPAAYTQLVSKTFSMPPAYVQDEGDTSAWWDSEEAIEFLNELMDAMDEVAPEGHYFGTHPGDGSDFGFWPTEESCDWNHS
jgi:hypothetical protein